MEEKIYGKNVRWYISNVGIGAYKLIPVNITYTGDKEVTMCYSLENKEMSFICVDSKLLFKSLQEAQNYIKNHFIYS